MSVWDRRKEILYGNGLVGEVNGTLSAMTIECECRDAKGRNFLNECEYS